MAVSASRATPPDPPMMESSAQHVEGDVRRRLQMQTPDSLIVHSPTGKQKKSPNSGLQPSEAKGVISRSDTSYFNTADVEQGSTAPNKSLGNATFEDEDLKRAIEASLASEAEENQRRKEMEQADLRRAFEASVLMMQNKSYEKPVSQLPEKAGPQHREKKSPPFCKKEEDKSSTLLACAAPGIQGLQLDGKSPNQLRKEDKSSSSLVYSRPLFQDHPLESHSKLRPKVILFD
eukprot:1359835-Amorphochlora_amoeboformis.AAC.1